MQVLTQEYGAFNKNVKFSLTSNPIKGTINTKGTKQLQKAKPIEKIYWFAVSVEMSFQ
jgi:hypothetical protein